MDTLTVKLVRKEDSTIDVDATKLAFATALTRHITERETETQLIANAVNAVFDKFPGVNVNLDALKTYVLTALNAQPANHSILRERVSAYIKENSQGKDLREKGAKEPVWERTEGYLYFVSKGIRGGVRRVSDMKKD